jgi:hypothetical protein
METPPKWWLSRLEITMLVLFVVLLALYIYMFIQWCMILRIERAVRNAWTSAEVCSAPGSDCNIVPVDVLWGLRSADTSSSSSTLYDPKVARTLIEFVGRMNVLKTPEDKPTSPLGYTFLRSFGPDEGPQFMGVWRSGDDIIIACRATATEDEVRHDLMFEQDLFKPPGATKNLMIHRGFLRIYSAYADLVADTIQKENPKHIYVTGHSLGGTTATLIAAEYGSTRAVSGYVFGCPNAGDDVADDHVRNHCPGFWRVSNRADIITQMPPRVTPSFNDPDRIMFYAPVGQEHSFDDNWRSMQSNHFLPLYVSQLEKEIGDLTP